NQIAQKSIRPHGLKVFADGLCGALCIENGFGGQSTSAFCALYFVRHVQRHDLARFFKHPKQAV
ncbi:hypothetical protein, partial [Neisseria musculi]|uniref:hypothetical protein n=1 Tax=Neisseria musculi TaxID=1815583 RepID=UPI0036181F1B